MPNFQVLFLGTPDVLVFFFLRGRRGAGNLSD